MGTFSGSIHVRATNSETVPKAVAKVARKLDCQFFVTPEVDGWVTVFPSESGQDVRVSKELARRIPSHVLHVILHDSDVFQYHYYREGRLQDRYSSRPDYFEKVSARERQALRGRPERLSEIVRRPEDVAALQDLLASKEPDNVLFAETMLESFGKLLGLPHCGTSYEYLESGEDEDIEGRDEFLHIPDHGPEVAQRKAAAAAAENEFSRLHQEGKLLWDETPAPALVCADASGQRFLTVFRSEAPGEASRLSAYVPPWTGSVPMEVPIHSKAGSFGISPSGRYLAMGHAFGDWSVRLWDLGSKKLVWEARDSMSVGIVGFTGDEDGLVTAGETIRVLAMGDGRQLRTIPVQPYNGVAALHPSGSALVALQGNSHLVAIDFATGRPIKGFTLEHVEDFSPFQMMYRALVTQAIGEARGKHIRTLERQGAQPGTPEAFERWKEQMLQPVSVSAEGVRHILFSADGRFLFCATDRAGWVFRWEALLASEESTPKALYRFCPNAGTSDAGIFQNLDPKRMALSLAHDVRRDLLLLGMGDGKIHQIDLGTGASQLLLQMPDALPVAQLGLSRDGTKLYTVLCPFLKDVLGPDRPAERFLIWDYGGLGSGGWKKQGLGIGG